MDMNNKSILERLSYHLNEEGYGKVEVLLRNLIADEQEAVSGYLKAAHKIKEKAEEHNDATGLKIVKVLLDIAKEEEVHIGELDKLMKLIGVSDSAEKEGEKEAAEKL